MEKNKREKRENGLDYTLLKNKLAPKQWKCPHCGRRNTTGKCADDILLRYFKYFEHCGCGYVHCWELKLTNDFKRSVIDYLTGGATREMEEK